MTATNPYPEANPFNTRQFGNYNVNRAASGFYISHTGKAAKNLKVPDQDQPIYGTPEWKAMHDKYQKLTVPDTAPDMAFNNAVTTSGFIPNSSNLFVTHDGTILDFKTGKVVRQALSKKNVINPGFPGQNEWGNTPSIDSLMSQINSKPITGYDDPNIDEYSRKYWKQAAEEAKKLEDSMTYEQKMHLQAFEAHFPKSRFIDESKM